MSDPYGMPDISQMAPATGPVGAPPSGTYGEGGPLQQLRDSLPAPAAPAAGPAAGPSGGGGGAMPMPPPSGALPKGISAPTTRPYEPMSTPLSQPIPVGETPSAQQRQQVEAWARDPSKSETFRMWAQSILDRLAS
jgi:hypothetical protein